MPHDHAHDHNDHGHSHAPAVTGENEHMVLLSFLLIAGFMVVEVIGGLLSGSLALLADAGHMMTDAVALALAYFAFRLGRRAADMRRTFGYARLEVVAGLLNAVSLFIIIAWILHEAWQRFREPQAVLTGPMMGVAVLGLLVNLLVLWLLMRGDRDHVNIRGAILHVLGDLLGSVGAILAAIVIYFTSWTQIDPILSVLVSLLILRSAWVLLKNALHILLEGAPEGISPDDIEHHLMAHVPDLATVGHIHVWSITSGRVIATMEIRPQDGAAPRDVVHAVEHQLEAAFGIGHATIAIDWDGKAGPCRLSHPRGATHHHDHPEPSPQP